MKKLIFIALVLIILSSCDRGLDVYLKGGVEQTSNGRQPEVNLDLCGCKVCVETFIWKDQQIAWSAYDHPDSTLSIIKHKKQADSLYAHINKYK